MILYLLDFINIFLEYCSFEECDYLVKHINIFKKIIPFLNMFDTSNDSEIISISLTIINKILDEKNEYFEIFDS